MADAYSTERGRSPLEIIHTALRDAVLAAAVHDALDVAGDALRSLAELVRAEEPRHA